MTTKRIFGVETEYGINFSQSGEIAVSPEELARSLFESVVQWGGSSNVFLLNASRLYLDVGSHPEFATAECDSVRQAVAYERAGDRIIAGLAEQTQQSYDENGPAGKIHIFKNNVDSQGNSYGCHENYLVRRQGDFNRLSDVLVPFLITRQIMVGAGFLNKLETGEVRYCFSQRSEQMWEAVSSATTRSRPIINTRDEPHADAEYYRRLHVIVGDSSMSEVTSVLKLGSTDLVLRMIEAGVPGRDFAIADPMQAIRDISLDITGKAVFSLVNGNKVTAIELQRVYLERVRTFLESSGDISTTDRFVMDTWERVLHALEISDLTLIDKDIDWAIKKRLIDRYQQKHDVPLSDPRIARLDLAFHDISPSGGLFQRLEATGLANRYLSELDVLHAIAKPPATTRAKLRGDFIRAASENKRAFSVDWVHLKLTKFPQQTISCKDPFSESDDRVQALINEIAAAGIPTEPQVI